ncbi:AMP-binding protein [Ralstonia insidiosa]|uniref:AMP-binding protein n=1 Tax=Ralstonia insidiosa TaxID=190721 RepID=A0A848P4Q4_9RALS|nr:AMP-binding protein [Ralstonia insidiosa]NMV39606.1 AMP-binding protein [Ralstonia insidiosa]
MPTYPLVSHTSLDHTLAWRDGAPVSVRAFLADVKRLAAMLPPGGHVFNACADRYRFAVGLCATLVAGKISLLPPMQTPQMVRQLAAFAPDVFCLHDASACPVDLPGFHYTEDATLVDALAEMPLHVPQIDASQVMAYLFTSGSTGTPVPHRKTWGALVRCMRAGAARLGLDDGRAFTLVGTVPAQHMYGFEVTVLLALQAGLALSNRQPFYPADIREALEAVPAPRVLVTSPVHLRALLASEPTLPGAALVLSATAPLSEALAREAEARLAAPLLEIYGSTETGQLATRRTAQDTAWHAYPDVHLELRTNSVANAPDDDGPTVWVSGGHVETPVPMGDTLELLDDTHFLLQGRKADLINIAGKRSSLAYLNHQLNAIPGVVDGVFFMPDDAPPTPHAYGGLPVTRLVALVVAPGLSAAALLRALHERIDAAFLPRPLLFVEALPRNGTGKLARDVLATLVAQQLERHHRKPAMRFTIPADNPALPGHFPGRPIVPGVVLLDHAIHTIGVALGRSLDACQLGSAKFLSPAAPGETLDLSFETAASGAIRFTIRAGERDVANGVLSAQASAPEGVPA